MATLELQPKRASLTAAMFVVLWFPVFQLSNPNKR